MVFSMQVYEIVPHVGIGPVRLGASREEVRAAIGSAPFIWRRFNVDENHWHQSSLQVHYEGQSQTVESIEVARSDEFVAVYKGIDVHRTTADELVAHVSRDTPFDDSDRELGYSYLFPAIELSLWRAVMPESTDDPDG